VKQNKKLSKLADIMQEKEAALPFKIRVTVLDRLSPLNYLF